MNSQYALALSRTATILLLDSMVRGMIVLLGAGAGVCFLSRVRAAARHRLWLLAIVLTGVMPLLVLLPGWRVLPAPQSAEDIPAQSRLTLKSDLPDMESSIPPVQAPATRTLVLTTASRQTIWPTWTQIATVVWALGAAVMGGRLLLSRVALSHLARRSMPAPDALQTLCRDLAPTSQIRLLQSDRTTLMPMTWGMVRPTILLPEGANQWPLARQRVVLLHELSHTERSDYMWICVAEAIAVAYWFNPLWRWALNQLRDEAEQACDEAVLNAGEDRCAYADELLATVKGHVRHRRATALALGMSRCSTLESRLKSILAPQPAMPAGRSRAFLLFLVVVILTVPLSQIRLEAQSRPATTQKIPSTEPSAIAAGEVTYGGTLQDTDGKPISGAKLLTGWQVPNRLGEFVKTSTTDDRGRWTVSAERSWQLQGIRGAEPGYVRLLVTKPDHELLLAKKLALTMVRSVSITGYVRDEEGQPIVGALITPPLIWNSVSRTRGPDPGPIYSGADGKFSVDGLSPTNMLLYISAQAFAPALVVPKRIDRPMIEMLSKGGAVPGIVLGLDKKPLANIKVTLTDWHYNGVHRFTRDAVSDASGRFVINHVPLEGDFWLRTSAPNLLSTRSRVTARDGPAYEVQIVRNAKAHVQVVDDATGKPITSFQYSVSEPIAGSDAIRFADFIHTTIESRDAKFDVEPRTKNIYAADQVFRIRVAADNYTSEDSPVFRVNSESYFTIRMKPAAFISGSVVNAGGSPVSNAEVAWVRPDRHAFVGVDGTLDTTYVDIPDSIVKTDAAGQFSNLKMTSASGSVVAITPAGYSALPSDAFSTVGKLTLKPWASLSGKFMRQDKPMVNQRVLLQLTDSTNAIWTQMVTEAAIDGGFSFRRVPGGAVKLTVSYDGRTYSETIDLKSGQAARHEFYRND